MMRRTLAGKPVSDGATLAAIRMASTSSAGPATHWLKPLPASLLAKIDHSSNQRGWRLGEKGPVIDASRALGSLQCAFMCTVYMRQCAAEHRSWRKRQRLGGRLRALRLHAPFQIGREVARTSAPSKGTLAPPTRAPLNCRISARARSISPAGCSPAVTALSHHALRASADDWSTANNAPKTCEQPIGNSAGAGKIGFHWRPLSNPSRAHRRTHSALPVPSWPIPHNRKFCIGPERPSEAAGGGLGLLNLGSPNNRRTCPNRPLLAAYWRSAMAPHQRPSRPITAPEAHTDASEHVKMGVFDLNPIRPRFDPRPPWGCWSRGVPLPRTGGDPEVVARLNP